MRLCFSTTESSVGQWKAFPFSIQEPLISFCLWVELSGC